MQAVYNLAWTTIFAFAPVPICSAIGNGRHVKRIALVYYVLAYIRVPIV